MEFLILVVGFAFGLALGALAAWYFGEARLRELRAELEECRRKAAAPVAAAAAPVVTAAAPVAAATAPAEAPAPAPVAAVPDPARTRDPLIDILGIGPVFQARFYDAGVLTFAELAALSPQQVREIIKPNEWQKIEPEAWIAEARQRAG